MQANTRGSRSKTVALLDKCFVRSIIQPQLNQPVKGQAMTESTGRELIELAGLLKVLSDPTRLAIFNALMQGVQCNCDLGERLGLPMNLISHHLKVLRQAGLVNMERDEFDARWVYYSVNRQALEELNHAFSAFFDPARIKPRLPTCGPRGAFVPLGDAMMIEG